MSHRIPLVGHSPHVNGKTRLPEPINHLEELPDEELEKFITEKLQVKLQQYCIQDLAIRINEHNTGALVIHGKSSSFHHKQVAFHRLKDVLEELNIKRFKSFANDITVL